jgi:hypothetical protein
MAARKEAGHRAGAAPHASAIAETGKSAVVDVWVDRNEQAPCTKNETMCK